MGLVVYEYPLAFSPTVPRLVFLQIVKDLMKPLHIFPISATYSRRYAGLTN